jgi:signal transduction histidine kinase
MAAFAGYGGNVRATTSPKPPLTKRLKPRHWVAFDYAVGALVGLIILVSLRHTLAAVVSPPGGGEVIIRHVSVGPFALVLAGATAIAIARRRREPTFMLGLLLAESVVVAVLNFGSISFSGIAPLFFVPTAYVLYYIVASFEDRIAVGRVLAAVFLTVGVDAVLLAAAGGLSGSAAPVIPATLCVIIGWAIGYIVRQRRRYSLGLQVEAASKAVAEERLRIARELHDVVAHSMSVIAIQAGYGQYVMDSQPADARAALGAIQATSREALDEMRRMLGALRQADQADQADQAGDGAADSAPLLPAPGLADLDRLLTRTGSAGVQVSLERRGSPQELAASIDMSAYRIIQEALTNVVKHAHASRCDVLLDYADEELVIEVTDSGAGMPVLAGAAARSSGHGPADGALAGGGPAGAGGHGIIGMRERVSLLGGSFSAGPLPGYGFQVTARIPLPPEASHRIDGLGGAA